MTHRNGYHAAAVALRREVSTIGIDAEINRPLKAGVLNRIASARELAMTAKLSVLTDRVFVDSLLFSIKESAYKAWFSLEKSRLRFRDIEVTIDLDGDFAVRFPVGCGALQRQFFGSWAADQYFLLTALCIDRGAWNECLLHTCGSQE
ncbi:4'-phosphopantetheinyl transferase superfamily protein [Actinomyces slackii]|uniref:4'-phosphopantetheinyl transferase superfamily protein n=1 Tax=Actinomyces slackii TaxID=52774 RepID=UPI000A03DBAB